MKKSIVKKIRLWYYQIGNENKRGKECENMIYTITFNPALDYTVQVEKFEIGKINRTKSENILAGGKGLNVSIILKRLGKIRYD